jgi:hypothetical protein
MVKENFEMLVSALKFRAGLKLVSSRVKVWKETIEASG